jgi:hypothetical protein
MSIYDSESSFNQIVEKAIKSELKSQPDSILVQKVMASIYSIHSNGSDAMIGENLKSLPILINGFSIAASILLGYFIGHFYVSTSTAQLVLVSFENLNMNILGFGL